MIQTKDFLPSALSQLLSLWEMQEQGAAGVSGVQHIPEQAV